MRTNYQIEIIEDETNGGIAYKLVDGFDGGELGLQYAIYDSRLLAHDILEHIPGVEHIGTAHDEAQALGAIFYTRPEISEQTKYDVLSILTDDYDGTIGYHVPEVTLIDEVDRDEIRRAAYHGVRMYRDECEYDSICRYSLYRYVTALMFYGYAVASTHYAQVDVSTMFACIVKQADAWRAHWLDESYLGCTFDVTLDWKEIECYISTEPNEWNEEEDYEQD